jgi:hypothetical protein
MEFATLRARNVRSTRRGVVLLLGGLVLAGCTTDRLTEPGQTGTEQLLISTAVDRAVEHLEPTIPPGTKVFVDAQFFDSAPGDAALYSKYAIASVRDRLLLRGCRLVDDRKAADMIAEVRTGGQSIDHHGFLIGIPSIPVPVPLTTQVAQTPKIALYERDEQTGVAKLAITAYDRDGALTASTGPIYGRADRKSWIVLVVVGWEREDIRPPDMKP